AARARRARARAGHGCAEPRLAAVAGRNRSGQRGNAAGLPLRGVHEPLAPPWWPPAPGWWVLAAVVLLLVAGWALWPWRKARRRRLAGCLFEGTVAAAASPAEPVAAISALLRRAARRIEPGADTLEGEAWLGVLDRGLPQGGFAQGPGALLR